MNKASGAYEPSGESRIFEVEMTCVNDGCSQETGRNYDTGLASILKAFEISTVAECRLVSYW